MEQEHEDARHTYRMSRLGFSFLALALVLASASSVFALAGQFFLDPEAVAWVVQSRWWPWLDTPIVWGSLVGTYLLWGRWTDLGWQRRTGLLVLMGILDVVLWFLEHGEALGLRLSEVGHHWLRATFGEALGWAEFALIASLACDLIAHLGVENAAEAGKATRSLAATGAVVWMLSFLERTAWGHGWPLEKRRGFVSLESLLLYLGSQMLWTITLIQVTALTIAATRQAARVLAEMDWDEQQNDLLKSRSDLDSDLLNAYRGDRAGDDDRGAYGR